MRVCGKTSIFFYRIYGSLDRTYIVTVSPGEITRSLAARVSPSQKNFWWGRLASKYKVTFPARNTPTKKQKCWSTFRFGGPGPQNFSEPIITVKTSIFLCRAHYLVIGKLMTRHTFNEPKIYLSSMNVFTENRTMITAILLFVLIFQIFGRRALGPSQLCCSRKELLKGHTMNFCMKILDFQP